MDKIAITFLLIFASFIVSPTVVMLVDRDADVSLVFTSSEEETSSKNHISSEYIIQQNSTQKLSIHILQNQPQLNHFYKRGYGLIFLDIVSPPPKLA